MPIEHELVVELEVLLPIVHLELDFDLISHYPMSSLFSSALFECPFNLGICREVIDRVRNFHKR